MPRQGPAATAAGRAPVELWLVDLARSGPGLLAIEETVPRLSVADRSRIASGASSDIRHEREVAYIALRLLIERMFGPVWRGVPFATIGTGKPVLEGLEGSFNLAHAGGHALVGLSATGDIGVDIEPARTIDITDERRARIERAAIALSGGAPLPSAREARFLQAWVRLEACAKADGSGIGRLLTGVGIVGERGVSEERAAEIGTRFAVRDVPAGADIQAAVAVPPGTALPLPRRLPSEPLALARLVTGPIATQGRG